MIKKANKVTNDLKLVLASASPRREDILKKLDLKFTIVPSKIDEGEFTNNNPIELVKTLALEKAKSVSNLVEDALVIAADTVVVYDQKILGKPEDEEAAKKMLQTLSDKHHQVITGIAVLNSQNKKSYVEYNITDVKMTNMTEKEIDSYVDTGEPMDKAGSYAIQGFGGLFVEEISGSYHSVMGLPIHQLAKLLDKFNYGIL
ncbi:MAG: Maf-like protein [Halanaerobium sp. 4-GBenrich]|jgi:septum formation protein|uniref:dTTP/UTP pyrophosphatase n=1 Tax=Halanaerobium congolense TaxID=54121 RepID=A0A1G6N321_9FIRM|nr:Maf family protein [Halanaerobium congolense]KXS48248.1 MAG: Maf-like protein [Halanaerobium sp. T82-1]ODS51030.1 MAG: Maf-like protein [Halanaerobium sp. 4-GBenrich]OEG62786.1 MAG: septum formation protein Maf [Halanaerobium sp. MDAL1]PUU93192.1 MAG: Maf-like protein [Halanaerobium sp.]PTX17508.1 septum formation protein [Halanaerobium congolense]